MVKWLSGCVGTHGCASMSACAFSTLIKSHQHTNDMYKGGYVVI